MPYAMDIEQRDRALMFVMLRLSSVSHFKHGFFPVGDDIEIIFVDWVEYLRDKKLFGFEDPLFPKTTVAYKPGIGFKAAGLPHEHWTTSASTQQIFKQAFELVGLPYANPHSFRSTLAQLGEHVCRSPEEFKAWSQNIGH